MNSHLLAASSSENTDLLVVATLFLVWFGVKKLPSFVPTLRQQIEELKKAREDFERRL